MIDRNVLTQSSAAMGGLTAEGNGHVRVSDVPPAEAAARILFVDLDGTLIRTDLLQEAALLLFKQSPWQFFRALPSLARGRAAFKRAIASPIGVIYIPLEIKE